MSAVASSSLLREIFTYSTGEKAAIVTARSFTCIVGTLYVALLPLTILLVLSLGIIGHVKPGWKLGFGSPFYFLHSLWCQDDRISAKKFIQKMELGYWDRSTVNEYRHLVPDMCNSLRDGKAIQSVVEAFIL
ncbi:MAG: hypothetical protein LBP65_00455 [Puniceicoccales bacterium]|nr:hypothetical protein [Puniceicoccales bacterium]